MKKAQQMNTEYFFSFACFSSGSCCHVYRLSVVSSSAIMSDVLSLSNPVFSGLALTSGVLTLKMATVTLLTVRKRFQTSVSERASERARERERERERERSA